MTRRWASRQPVQEVKLFIADDLHMMTDQKCQLEVIVSRMRYISSQLESPIRFIALSSPIANYSTVAEWLGAESVFNFSPSVRPVQLDIFPKTFDHNDYRIRTS